MTTDQSTATDVATLEQLNLDYNQADQTSDAQRFNEFLADDFVVQTPGVTRNREEYLEYIAGPRPFTDLTLLESRVRLFGDVALIHGRTSYKLVSDGSTKEALYTDAYQRRGGVWLCISACAIAPGA
jgi:ketosteroid isomerase-like protein